MTDIQYLDPLTWPILQYDYGIHFIPVSDSAPDGWGPPFVDGGGAPINGGMGTVGTTPAGIVVTRTGPSSYSMRRGIAANTPAISQTQRCSAIDGQLIFRSADSNRYWCHPNSSVIYYKNAQLTTAPATVCGLSVFEESGSKYLCVITAVSSGNDITITAYVRPWLDSYVNGDLYDAVTNHDGWQQVGSQTFNEPADPDDSDYYGLRIRQGFYFSDDGKSAVSVAWTWCSIAQTRSAPRGLFNVSVSSSSATITWSRTRPLSSKIQYGGGASGTRTDNDTYTALADYRGSTLIEGTISSGDEYKSTYSATANYDPEKGPYHPGSWSSTLYSTIYSYLEIDGERFDFRDYLHENSYTTTQTVQLDGNQWDTVSSTGWATAVDSHGYYIGGNIRSGSHLFRRENSIESNSGTSTAYYPDTSVPGSGSTDRINAINVYIDGTAVATLEKSFSEPNSSGNLYPKVDDYTFTPVPITETPLTGWPLPMWCSESFFIEPTTDRCLGYQANDGHMFAVVYGIYDLQPTYSNEPFYEFDSDQIIPYYTPVGTSVGSMIGIYGTNPNYLDVRHV